MSENNQTKRRETHSLDQFKTFDRNIIAWEAFQRCEVDDNKNNHTKENVNSAKLLNSILWMRCVLNDGCLSKLGDVDRYDYIGDKNHTIFICILGKNL